MGLFRCRSDLIALWTSHALHSVIFRCIGLEREQVDWCSCVKNSCVKRPPVAQEWRAEALLCSSGRPASVGQPATSQSSRSVFWPGTSLWTYFRRPYPRSNWGGDPVMSRRTRSSSQQPQAACPATGMDAEGRAGPAPATSATAAAGAAANAPEERVGAKRARPDLTFTEEDYSCPICLNLLLVSWDSRQRHICRRSVGRRHKTKTYNQAYRVYLPSIRIASAQSIPRHTSRAGRGLSTHRSLHLSSFLPRLDCRTRLWAPVATTFAPTASGNGPWTSASRAAPPAARRWPQSCPACAAACSAPWRLFSQRWGGCRGGRQAGCVAHTWCIRAQRNGGAAGV